MDGWVEEEENIHLGNDWNQSVVKVDCQELEMMFELFAPFEMPYNKYLGVKIWGSISWI